MKSVSVFSLIAANAILLIAAIAMNWKIFDIIFVFWIENVIIGILNIFKIILANGESKTDNTPFARVMLKIFLVPFFCVHFFGFCAGHGTFILFLFGTQPEVATDHIPTLLSSSISDMASLIIGVAAIFTSHLISFFVNFVGKKEYASLDPGNAMFMPYKRIVLVHLVIIFGGFIIVTYGSESVFILVLFFSLKVIIDLWRHRAEHKNQINKSDNTTLA